MQRPRVRRNAISFAVFTFAALPSGEIVKVLRRADVREQLASQGASAVGSRPDELAAYIRAETIKWGKVLKAAGVKVE